MTFQELEDAIQGFTENSVTKLKVRSWAATELGRIINRRYYWWRKKVLQLTTAAGTATYDLTTVNASAYPDFAFFASSLYCFNSDGSQTEITLTEDHRKIMQMQNDLTQGTPKIMAIEPGTTKTLRLSPIPNAPGTYAAMYYRAYIANWTSPGDKVIPILPPEFHYVLLQAMERRAFTYLYGQKDPRAVLSLQAEQQCLADLDAFKGPSTVSVAEWRSGDETAFVQSTN